MQKLSRTSSCTLGLGLSLALLACGSPKPDPMEMEDPPDLAAPTEADGASPAAADLLAPRDLLSPPDLLVPPPLVRFVAMGDTGKGNEGQRQVAAAIARKCAESGCDFVQLLGDNIYDSGVSSVNDAQWQSKFEQPYKDIDLPFFAVLGNHDYGADGAGTDFARGQHEVDYSTKSTKWRMPGKHYHVTNKHVEFFGLDSNMMMFNQVASQKQQMNTWIAASAATWKIAMGHHPYLSNGPHGNAGSYEGLPWIPIVNGKGVKDFLEDVVCGKVDLYICGHDHSRQWPKGTCKGTELIVSGAGASTTELKGKNQVHFQAETLGFVYIRIEGRKLTAEFIDTTGKIEFTRTLMK